MPELPEVETIKNDLAAITGRRFTAITINDARPVKNPLQEFTQGLIGRRVLKVERRGKYLIFRLSGGKYLLIHLRMTGSLLVNPPRLDKFARIVFQMDGQQIIDFRDVRRFGTAQIVDNAEEVVGKLGVEPLSSKFTVKRLAKLLNGRQAPVKAVLLDQHVIAGLGNMYTDEALFASGIHPLRKGGSLSSRAIERLHHAIITVLKEAIDCGGASIVNYQRTDGSEGTAHHSFKVAHRLGQNCRVCGTPIRRIVIRQRGTYFCPRCQK